MPWRARKFADLGGDLGAQARDIGTREYGAQGFAFFIVDFAIAQGHALQEMQFIEVDDAIVGEHHQEGIADEIGGARVVRHGDSWAGARTHSPLQGAVGMGDDEVLQNRGQVRGALGMAAGGGVHDVVDDHAFESCARRRVTRPGRKQVRRRPWPTRVRARRSRLSRRASGAETRCNRRA
jgi:hypothetical protein